MSSHTWTSQIITAVPNPSPPLSPRSTKRRPSILASTATSLASPILLLIPKLVLSASLPPLSPNPNTTAPAASKIYYLRGYSLENGSCKNDYLDDCLYVILCVLMYFILDFMAESYQVSSPVFSSWCPTSFNECCPRNVSVSFKDRWGSFLRCEIYSDASRRDGGVCAVAS